MAGSQPITRFARHHVTHAADSHHHNHNQPVYVATCTHTSMRTGHMNHQQRQYACTHTLYGTHKCSSRHLQPFPAVPACRGGPHSCYVVHAQPLDLACLRLTSCPANKNDGNQRDLIDHPQPVVLSQALVEVRSLKPCGGAVSELRPPPPPPAESLPRVSCWPCLRVQPRPA